MNRHIRAELRKIWESPVFLAAAALLLCIDLLLLGGKVLQENIPAESYRTFTRETSQMTDDALGTYLTERYETVKALKALEDAEIRIAQGTLTAEAAHATYGELYTRYGHALGTTDMCKYTGDLQSEYRFLNELYGEWQTVSGYADFLHQLDREAEALGSIGIFSKSSSFVARNLQKTRQDYAHMTPMAIRYIPQKGLYTAVNFPLSDDIALVLLLFAAFCSLRVERDREMLGLIRSTTKGRAWAAGAKIIAMDLTALGIVLGIYAVNLLFCACTYGLGPLMRPVQSVPFLMRSTLKLPVAAYLGMFVFTKWLALSVIGGWILLCALLPKKASTACALAVGFPMALEVLRQSIPVTGPWGLLRFLNVMSLLQTNELLGSYMNLNVFGFPVDIISVETFSGALHAAAFTIIFLFTFSRAALGNAGARSAPARRKITHMLFLQETYKLLIMNGGAVILAVFLGVQIFQAATAPSFLTPKELYLREYMKSLAGPLTQEKADALMAEKEVFAPLDALESALQSGEIDQEEYDERSGSLAHLKLRREVFSELYETYIQGVRSGDFPGFLYASGYPAFFGLNCSQNAVEYLLVSLCAAFLFAPVFAGERAKGMDVLLSVTPFGKRRLLAVKLRLCAVLCGVMTSGSLLKNTAVMLRDRSFSAVSLSVTLIPAFSSLPEGMSVLEMILLFVLLRFLGIAGLSLFVLTISSKLKSPVPVAALSVITLCLPVLLYMAGQPYIQCLGFFPLFDFPGLLSRGQNSLAIAALALGLAAPIFCLLCLYGDPRLSEDNPKHRRAI